jgi:hypothetical protein
MPSRPTWRPSHASAATPVASRTFEAPAPACEDRSEFKRYLSEYMKGYREKRRPYWRELRAVMVQYGISDTEATHLLVARGHVGAPSRIAPFHGTIPRRECVELAARLEISSREARYLLIARRRIAGGQCSASYADGRRTGKTASSIPDAWRKP